MSDLVKRLREPMQVTLKQGAPELDEYDVERAEAADRIEALEAALAEARGQVAALRGALETWIDPCGDLGCEECNVLFDTAATAQAHDAEVRRRAMKEAAEIGKEAAKHGDCHHVAAAIRAAAGEVTT